MAKAELDAIARSVQGYRIHDAVEDTRAALDVSEEDLEFMRPTIVAGSYDKLGSDSITIGLILAMAISKGKTLSLVFTDLKGDGQTTLPILHKR